MIAVVIALVSSWWGVIGGALILAGISWRSGVHVGEVRERFHAEQRAALIDDKVARETLDRYEP